MDRAEKACSSAPASVKCCDEAAAHVAEDALGDLTYGDHTTSRRGRRVAMRFLRSTLAQAEREHAVTRLVELPTTTGGLLTSLQPQ
ncbi:MAG TPA: hypothetical protein VHT50_17320 [Mycobacterium sp.]|nr:hypothetical protein [Mycobacterium sp.]